MSLLKKLTLPLLAGVLALTVPKAVEAQQNLKTTLEVQGGFFLI